MITNSFSKTNAASFIGNIPEEYDRGLGPMIFVDYAADIARRVASLAPGLVLEIAAGTGIVTRRLRDLLPESTLLTATDLNPPMLNVARGKFRSDEYVLLAIHREIAMKTCHNCVIALSTLPLGSPVQHGRIALVSPLASGKPGWSNAEG